MRNIIIYGVSVKDFPKYLVEKSLIVDTIEYSPSLTTPFNYEDGVISLVYCLGGDGSLLGAEYLFPGIPKLPIRSEKSYAKCGKHFIENVVLNAENNFDKLVAKELLKIQYHLVSSDEKSHSVAYGINDITIRNSDQRTAIRFDVYINGIKYNTYPIVGDGIVVATPFGSSGYYRSITKAFFSSGLGIGFNNTTEPIDNLVVSEDSSIEIKILRGIGVISSDNNPHMDEFREGDNLVIGKSRNSSKVKVFGLDNLYCCECKEVGTRLAGGRRHPSFK